MPKLLFAHPSQDATEERQVYQLANSQHAHSPRRHAPAGRLVLQPTGSLEPRDPDNEEEPAHWTLDAWTEAARASGIQIKRGQVRRIWLAEGVPWRQTHTWARSTNRNFGPQERQ